MRTQKLFSTMFGVTERYADYLLSEQRVCSRRLAEAVAVKLGVPKGVLIFPEEREGKTLMEILKPKLEAALPPDEARV